MKRYSAAWAAARRVECGISANPVLVDPSGGSPLGTTNTITVSDSVNSRRPVRSAPFIVAARTALSIAAQIAVLWSIDIGASAAVAWFRVPVPGNVVGLALLFALLCGGVVKAPSLEPAAGFLVKHFAFFFIPVTIGPMGMGPMFALHGVGILLALAVSAAVGMAMCGLTSQCLMNAQNAHHARLGSEHNV